MHHFIYPSQDTFITNTVGYADLNFGLDEILRVGTMVTPVKVTQPTTTYTYSETTVANFCVMAFTGSITTGSLWGSASFISGTVFNDYDDPVEFTVDYFSGSVSAMVVGWETGSYLSSSNFSGSLFGFSGSITVRSSSLPTWDQLINEYENWQSVWNWASYSGSLMGFVSGTFSSSYFGIFNGRVENFTGKIMAGTISGSQVRPVQKQYVTSSFFYNRALVQFDISAISSAMAAGDITNPKFTLKMNTAREENMPIVYTLYVYPISQSWVMGNGYVSNAGSTQGASWEYRDYQGGTRWATSGSSYLTSPAASQSFNYEVGDINLDITNIVTAWISGTVPNNGVVIISSDEYSANPTGMSLYFFSRDTNTIYSPRLDVGWPDVEWTTGSISTASISYTTSSTGLYGTLTGSTSMSGHFYGGFSGVGMFQSGSASMDTFDHIVYDWDTWVTNWESTTGMTEAWWGFIDITGQSGLINGWHIFGNFSGSISRSLWQSYRQCRACQPNFNSWWPVSYPEYLTVANAHQVDTTGPGFSSGPCSCGSTNPWWLVVKPPWWWNASGQCCYNSGSTQVGHTGGYQWVNVGPSVGGPCPSGSATGSWVTMSFVIGTLLNGAFSGSTFTASLVNGYQLNYGIINGTWNSSLLNGTVITSSWPMLLSYPSAVYVYLSSTYLNGMALGALSEVSASSGIFDGVFVNGTYAGQTIHAPYTGSIATASVMIEVLSLQSSSLSPVNINKPFVTVIQNIPPVVKAGNVIRINVFARPEFPLKNFNRQTQFEQYLIPQYLPSSSYYSIKDNETEEIILDFDNYTQISCDASGNYFMLDTTGLPQERYFRLLIKTEQSGSVYVFDKGDVFKIVR